MKMTQPFFEYAVSALSNLFYPQLCAGCSKEITRKQQLLCIHCLNDLPVTDFQLHAANPVEKIFWGRVPIRSASSHYYFTKNSVVQILLHGLKYQGKKEVGIFFGEKIGHAIYSCNRFAGIEGVIPVPLHRKKETLRGYNQAALICEGIQHILQVPVYTNVLERERSTETQTNKNRIQRWSNMSGKFKVKNRERISGRHLLLVDDVVTTGATLEACAKELLEIKDTTISIATVAYAFR